MSWFAGFLLIQMNLQLQCNVIDVVVVGFRISLNIFQIISRVRNCVFLIANATKKLVLATIISQLVTIICHLATENNCQVARWRQHKKVNFSRKIKWTSGIKNRPEASNLSSVTSHYIHARLWSMRDLTRHEEKIRK